MTGPRPQAPKKFFVELIKPTHYDDHGYAIQWWKAFSVSNSLACLNGLVRDAAQRRILGDDVEIVTTLHDDHCMVVPARKIIDRINQPGNSGLICMVGVQTNQYPRAVDLARPFRAAGIPVAIGGFHVSAAIARHCEPTADIQQALDLGITLFGGEAEQHLDPFLVDAYEGRLKPVYDFLDDLPDLKGQPTPFLPQQLIKRSLSSDIAVDTSRGCPFDCSFCTIINIQGRQSRFRTADDVEALIHSYPADGKKRPHFFFTDDNFARNKNWEAIFDRLIEMYERDGYRIKFGMQVDATAHQIPGFVDKARRAGCNSVFIGMESINPENLKAANKPQNQVQGYREMLDAWHEKRVVIMAGYILGFPADTPESIERDLRTIQQELPVDILMFFCLTPLPGSADYNNMLARGEWMEPDLNRYDSEHATVKHPTMSAEAWESIFRRAWEIYYSPEHVERLLRRAIAGRIGVSKLIGRIIIGNCGMRCEHVHPFQYGAIRHKRRSQRRHGMPLESPFIFYPRRLWEFLSSGIRVGLYAWGLERLKNRLKREAGIPRRRMKKRA